MLKALTVLELFQALSPAEQQKCRAAIGTAPVLETAQKAKRQRPQLRPEHRTAALVYDLIVRENGITFQDTNLQAETPALPARQGYPAR